MDGPRALTLPRRAHSALTLDPWGWYLELELTCDDRATEMDVTMIGLQNAGKTSLLRVLAVSESFPTPAMSSSAPNPFAR